MANFTCPSCNKDSILLKDKYAMGYWMTRRCSECSAIICSNAILLGVLTFAYLWTILMFGGLTFFDRDPGISWIENILSDAWHYILYMVAIWVVLDIVNIKYIPLMVIRR